MNSESPTPESDNPKFELESSDRSPSPPTASDAVTDIWSEVETTENVTEDTITEPEQQEPEAIPTPEVLEMDDSSSDRSSPTEPSGEPELFVDRWLDEADSAESETSSIANEVEQLQQQKDHLHQEIETLKAEKEQMLLQQVREVQENMGRMVEEGTKELKERKMALQIEIEKLERRKERIDREMRSNFAGSSQELAVRVQGFKDYLVGSLQDLASAAEKLELSRAEAAPKRERVRGRRDPRPEGAETKRRTERGRERDRERTPQAQFTEPTFANQNRRIRQLIDKYRNSPDYYGAPWQLRRTFELSQAKKVQEWFFVQGGRGAVDSMGSRLQNILVASAAISILHSLYSDRCRVLVLTDTPENLGEWRRGLQDCLGISRSNFGTNRGVVLFDSPDTLVQRAERLVSDKLLPIIIIDETEELLNLAILKFPLWLAFASTNKSSSSNYLY